MDNKLPTIIENDEKPRIGTSISTGMKFEESHLEQKEPRGLTLNKTFGKKDTLRNVTSNIFFDTKIKDKQDINNNDFSKTKTYLENQLMHGIDNLKEKMGTTHYSSNSRNDMLTPINNKLIDIEKVDLEDIYYILMNCSEFLSLVYNTKIGEDIVDIDYEYLMKVKKKSYNAPIFKSEIYLDEKQPETNMLNSKILNMFKNVYTKNDVLARLYNDKFNILLKSCYLYLPSLIDNDKDKRELNLFLKLDMLFLVGIVAYIAENPSNESVIASIGPIASHFEQTLMFIILQILKKVKDEYSLNNWYIKLKNILTNKLRIKDIPNNTNFLLINQNVVLLNMLKVFISKKIISKDLIEINKILMNIMDNIDKYDNFYLRDIVLNMKDNILQNFKEMRERERYKKPTNKIYLPPLPNDEKDTTFTLVLDLDETLVHYSVSFN